MNLPRLFTLLWLSGLGVLGIAPIENYFGPEYGVLYFFTVFPLALFIQTTKELKVRKKRTAIFTWMIGTLVGYCLFQSLHLTPNVGFSAIFSIILSIVAHLLFDRALKFVARKSEAI